METLWIRFLSRFGFIAVILTPLVAGAWGRRGHQVIGETAAIIVSAQPNSDFMRNQSFNFGYYANVPDFIWKRPGTYSFEKPEHFMDLEIFEREFAKHPEIKNPLALSRKDFAAKFPEIGLDVGRSFWRIREFYAELEKITQQLRDLKEPTGEARQKLQEKWLVLAGLMAHYVGDLSMPLHVSENYDGLMTGQKGVHGFFEEVAVDELYPEIGCEVNKEARKQWPAFTKKNSAKSLFELLMDLAERSKNKIPKLLAIDKKSKRDEFAKSAQAFKPMILEQLVDGSLTLAEIYRRQLGWTFDGNKFYFFAAEPEYIMPGAATPPAKQ